MLIGSSDVVTSNTGEPFISVRSGLLKYEDAYFYKYCGSVARWRWLLPGFAGAATAGSAPPVFPYCNLLTRHKKADAPPKSLFLTTHSCLSLTVGPPWHQTPGEPKGFGGWCVSATRSASLLSGARCRNVSRCKPHHHLHSRPGGEISARHGARPRELICQCDTLALASHWSVDHVTGSDWWRVTSGQLHQIWPGCSWASSSSSTLCSPLLLQDSTTISLAAPSHWQRIEMFLTSIFDTFSSCDNAVDPHLILCKMLKMGKTSIYTFQLS